MLLNGKIDDDADKDSPDSPSKAWWIGAGICLFPVYLFFSTLGAPGRGTAAICFSGALIAVVRLRWDLKDRISFWLAVSVLGVIHILLILLIPWPNTNYTLPIVLPLGVGDALVISYLIQRLLPRAGSGD
jgi:hypothetical protein